jgi:hypothetical protein
MKALFLFVLSMCGIARTQTVSTWGEQMACANTAQREGRYAKSEECLRAPHWRQLIRLRIVRFMRRH